MSKHSESREYDINDPALLESMMLSKSIRHPDTGVVLVTRKTHITPKIIKQLVSRNIENVRAESVAGEMLNEAVEDVAKIFDMVDGIIHTKGQSVQSAAATFQEMEQAKELQGMVKKRMKDILHLFNPRAADAMIELNNHHPNTAHHSIITGFNVMGIAKELGWDEEHTLNAVMAAMQHDIGKIKVKLDTLDWPGRLDTKRWGEIQLHSLFGGRLLYGGELDHPVMVALTHHEWYSEVEGKGYGGFSRFRKYLKKGMDIDINAYLKKATEADLEIMQISAMADMISALEEIRSYKGALPPFKVMVIMNSDAGMGHFNPKHYRAWHAVYTRKTDEFLPQGLRVALPREKEIKVFEPGEPRKLVKPIELLTYEEMDRLGLIPRLASRGLDIDRMRRRGGLLLERLRRLESAEGSVGRLITTESLEQFHIQPVKKVMPRERQLITFKAFSRSLSYASLKKLDLLYTLKQKRFDIDLIKRDDGIRISRMEKRGVKIRANKMEKLGINPIRPFEVRLPAYEDRLSLDELLKMGFEEKRLKRMPIFPTLQKSRNGVAVDQLNRQGLKIARSDIARAKIDPEKKIFYDIIVVRSIS